MTPRRRTAWPGRTLRTSLPKRARDRPCEQGRLGRQRGETDRHEQVDAARTQGDLPAAGRGEPADSGRPPSPETGHVRQDGAPLRQCPSMAGTAGTAWSGQPATSRGRAHSRRSGTAARLPSTRWRPMRSRRCRRSAQAGRSSGAAACSGAAARTCPPARRRRTHAHALVRARDRIDRVQVAVRVEQVEELVEAGGRRRRHHSFDRRRAPRRASDRRARSR